MAAAQDLAGGYSSVEGFPRAVKRTAHVAVEREPDMHRSPRPVDVPRGGAPRRPGQPRPHVNRQGVQGVVANRGGAAAGIVEVKG